MRTTTCDNNRNTSRQSNQIPSNFKTKKIDQSESIIFFQNGDRFSWHRGRLCLTFNSAVDLNIGFQHYSSRRCSFQSVNFYYKKKYLINIEFENIMTDPTGCDLFSSCFVLCLRFLFGEITIPSCLLIFFFAKLLMLLFHLSELYNVFGPLLLLIGLYE